MGQTIKQKIAALIGVTLLVLNAPPAFADEPIDFDSQVMPVLTKLGCNAGSCHGSAAGRGDFRLSLYGSKPELDYDAIVRYGNGRRVNLSDAEQSLLLRKPGGELDHGGEQLFEFDDLAGKILSQWIQQGATRRSQRKVTKLDVGPRFLTFPKPLTKHPFKAIATFDDGSQSDATRWTRFETSDESAVRIDAETNLTTIMRRGRHVVIARYMNQVVPIEIVVPIADQIPTFPARLGNSLIDRYVDRKLRLLRLSPTARINDNQFIRRVTLDLTGRLPTPQQILAFEKDDSKGKRGEYVDRLLESDEFVDYWTYRLARQLRVRSQPGDKTGVRVYYDWLRVQIDENRGWNQIARDLLLAEGDSHRNGAANFYRTTNNPKLQAEFVSESLLGIKLRCANCHDHPLDHWTQNDYHGLAAIFAKVDQKRNVKTNSAGEVIQPLTQRPAIQRIPGQRNLTNSEKDGRRILAEWTVDSRNPYFARAMVNRTWAALLGRGLIDPVDDLRATNPATHPQLLKELTAEFVQHDFDIRYLIRLICASETYQRQTGKTKSGTVAKQFYAVASLRSLPAEVVADAIDDVTGIATNYENQPAGKRAIQLPDPSIPSESLDILGRCPRTDSCESSETTGVGGLSTQLHLLNGNLVNQKLAAKGNRLQKLLQQDLATAEIVDEFYLRCLGHKPNPSQRKYWLTKLATAKAKTDAIERAKLLEDFVWSLLTCREFLTNH